MGNIAQDTRKAAIGVLRAAVTASYGGHAAAVYAEIQVVGVLGRIPVTIAAQYDFACPETRESAAVSRLAIIIHQMSGQRIIIACTARPAHSVIIGGTPCVGLTPTPCFRRRNLVSLRTRIEYSLGASVSLHIPKVGRDGHRRIPVIRTVVPDKPCRLAQQREYYLSHRSNISATR